MTTGRPPSEPCCSSPTREQGEGRPSATYLTDVVFKSSIIPTPVDRPPQRHPAPKLCHDDCTGHLPAPSSVPIVRPHRVSSWIRTEHVNFLVCRQGYSYKFLTLGLDVYRSAAAWDPVYDPGPPILQLSEDTEAGNTRLAPLGHSHKQGYSTLNRPLADRRANNAVPHPHMKRARDVLLQPTQPMSSRLPKSPTPVDRPPQRHPAPHLSNRHSSWAARLLTVVEQRWGLKDTRETARALTAQPLSSSFRSSTCEHGPQTLSSKRTLLLLLAPSPARICLRSTEVPANDIAVVVFPGHPNLRPARRQR